MAYLATDINPSPTIVGKLDKDYVDLRGRAVKFDANGNLTTATADTDTVIGVVIMSNDKDNLKQGEDVHVQIKDQGRVIVGAAVKPGQELMVDNSGRFIPATAGKRFCAISMGTASAADEYVVAIIGRTGTVGASA